MNLDKLSRDSWHVYFDRMSRVLDGKEGGIEIDSASLGVHAAALWLPLFGIVYEQRSDLLEIALEGVDHLIHRPREVFVEQQGLALVSMEVVDADGLRHILRLRDPLMLPPPGASVRVGPAHP